MTVPEHDHSDPLERDVAHDESATVEEREAMLAALRRLPAKHPRLETEGSAATQPVRGTP